MTSSARIAGGDIQLSVDRAAVSEELQQLRATVRSTFAGMSDDALKFASAQDRLDRALKQSNGKITSSVRSAELNLRRVQTEATRANTTVVRSANESSAALQREERAFGRLGRGALAGTGLLRGLGRSVAFASSTFLGGFGLIYAIESSTSAAAKQQEAEGQLAVALKNRGQAVEDLRGKVAELVAADAQLGFGEADTTHALTLAVTATGSLAGATRLLSVAQNVARARGTDLFEATQLLTRAFTGSGRGLKALGVDVKNGTKGFEALDAVQSKYAGRAIAYANSEAGARARLRAELERTKVTIGNELLPFENRLANAVANYLGKAQNQAAIQRDVNGALKTGSAIVHGFQAAYNDLAPVVRTITGLLGGTKTATELLFAVYAGNKIKRALIELGLLRTATLGVGTAAGVAAVETEAAMTGVAASEGVAAGRLAAVRTGLLGLSGLTLLPIIIPVEVVGLEAAAAKIKALQESYLGPQSATATTQQELALVPGLAKRYKAERKAGYTSFEIIRGFREELGNAPQADEIIADAINYSAGGPEKARIDKLLAARKPPAKKPPRPGTGNAPAPRLDRYTSIQLQLAAAQTAVARGEKGAQQLIAALKAEIDYDRDYERQQERLLKTDPKNAKAHADNLKRLYAEEQSARDEIAGIERDATEKRKAAAAAAARAAKRRHDAVRRAHTQTLAGQLGAIEARITTAETGETDARTVAQLKLQQDRERKARQDLVRFYQAESHDPQLTVAARASARKAAAKARQELAKLNDSDRADQLKFAVDVAQNALLETTEGTRAYDRAEAAYKAALKREIAYYAAQARRRDISLAAKRKDVAAELAARKQLAAEDKKTKPAAGGGAAENQRQFLADVQRIISAYAPNAFPTQAPVSTGKLETHGYDTVNELRRQTSFLRALAGRDSFPASTYQGLATVAALG